MENNILNHFYTKYLLISIQCLIHNRIEFSIPDESENDIFCYFEIFIFPSSLDTYVSCFIFKVNKLLLFHFILNKNKISFIYWTLIQFFEVYDENCFPSDKYRNNNDICMLFCNINIIKYLYFLSILKLYLEIVIVLLIMDIYY